MKKTFVFLSAVALLGIGLIWSCSDDENDYTANNQSGQSMQKAIGGDDDDFWYGKYIADKDGGFLRCDRTNVNQGCCEITITATRLDVANVVSGLGDAFDDGTIIPYITTHRDLLDEILDTSLLNKVVSGELTLVCKKLSNGAILLLFKENGKDAFVYTIHC